MADKKPAAKAAPAKGKSGSAGKKEKMISSLYEVSGDSVKKKNKPCPKCGAGVFLAEHSDRRTCGKCGYMEKR